MNSFNFCGLGLEIPKYRVVVFGDLHIGLSEHLANQGVQVPYDYYSETMELIEKSLSKCSQDVKDIIFAGDIKHEFGKISKEEWFVTKKLLEKLNENYNVRVIKGNHDTIIKPILDKLGIFLEENIQYGEFFITHGHKMPKQIPKEVKYIVVAHEHPAITLRKGPRQETYKCFIEGQWGNKTIIVLPAVSPLTLGTNVMKEEFFSPILKKINKEKMKVIVVSDDLENFYLGTLKDVRKVV